MPKLPQPDLSVIQGVAPALVARAEPMWRIHTAVGPHALGWNDLREYGPLPSARFDPWPPPPGLREDGVGYFAFSWAACLAEVFQDRRTINTQQPGYQISGFVPSRQLALLDLTGDYPIQVGASHSLNGASKHLCRDWAVAFTNAIPNLDGMLYTGMAGQECVVLYEPSRNAFPSAPSFSSPLDDRAIQDRVASAAKQIGYRHVA